MKKLFCLVLVVLLSISPVAFADTITIDLDAASIEELEAAKDAIDARIVELSNNDTVVDGETITLTGSGTKILDGFEIDAQLTKFIASCTEDTKITWYTADGNSSTYGKYGESQKSYSTLIKFPITITTIMIESQGEWQFTFSPIGAMVSPCCAGTGSFISDAFQVSPPHIAHITLTCDTYELCSVSLRSIRKNGTLGYEEVIPWGTRVHGTTTYDVIIKPEKDVVFYIWEVSCPPNVSWSIS